MSSEFSTGVVISARVKFFSAEKGYGFLIPESTGPDIMLHINALRDFGIDSIEVNASVKVSVEPFGSRWRVRELIELTPPEPDVSALHRFAASMGIREDITQIIPRPARVKWFDEAKGYGFVSVFGLAVDVYIHRQVLKGSQVHALTAGEAIAVRVAYGERGYAVVGIVPWPTDSFLRDPNDSRD
jgi:CspA family cold shock protein